MQCKRVLKIDYNLGPLIEERHLFLLCSSIKIDYLYSLLHFHSHFHLPHWEIWRLTMQCKRDLNINYNLVPIIRFTVINSPTARLYILNWHYFHISNPISTLIHFNPLTITLINNQGVSIFIEKLLGPLGGLLTWFSLTSQPIKCYYLCKCDITW